MLKTPILQAPSGPLLNRGLKSAIIRSGTSRFVVVSGSDLPRSNSRGPLLASLVAGETSADGLGGEHYQLNKIVVVDADAQHGFSFCCYQLDRATKRLLAGVECANAASAAALFLMVSGGLQPTAQGTLWGRNRGTGQLVQLTGLTPHVIAGGDVAVRFLFENQELMFSGSSPRLAAVDGLSVPFWVLGRGNTFVFAAISPHSIGDEAVQALTQAGANVAGAAVGPIKLICFEPASRSSTGAVINAVCYSNGELHGSLPGSGMMNLTALLAGEHLEEERPVGASGEFIYVLQHPAGHSSVKTGWVHGEGGYQAEWAELETPARVLMNGQAIVPRLETYQ